LRAIPGRGRPVYDQLVNWLAARIAALPPRAQDGLLALVLAVVNVITVLPELSQMRATGSYLGMTPPRGLDEPVALGLLVLQAVPLIWRRSWPIAVFLLVGIPRSTYDQLGFGFAPVPLGPAISYATVMERSSTGTRWALSAVLVTGIFYSQTLPGHTEPYDLFVQLYIFAAAGIVGVLSRGRRANLGEVEARAARAEAELDGQAARAAARERSRIARELHDVVAHHVSLMAVQAEAASSLLPDQPVAAARSVHIIGETARQALTELRRLLGVLRGPGEQPAAAPTPSLGDLDSVLAQVRGAGLAVDLTVQGDPAPLAPGVDLAAYRIVQESLTNALRHSDADSAAVRILYEPGFVTVAVTDGPQAAPAPARPADAEAVDGYADEAASDLTVAVTDGPQAAPAPARLVGARPAAGHADEAASDPVQEERNPAATRREPGGLAPPSGRPKESRGGRRGTAGPGGFGLAGITERVASCGGTLTVGPTQAGGFAVTARLPVA
jgi:signal transduction histidine kinase